MTDSVPDGLPFKTDDQEIGGIVVLKHPSFRVLIIVKDIDTGQEWRDSGIAPAPFQKFCNALQKWRASLIYPTTPRPRTRTLNETEVESYCLRYRQACEIMGKGEALTKFRTQLWREYRTTQEAAGKPIKPGKLANTARHNFIDVLDAYLEEWIKNKELNPYNE